MLTRAVVLALLGFAPLLACGSKGAPRVAELAAADGTVAASTTGAAWAEAAVGQFFRIGDAVRTGADGGARLRLIRGGGLHLAPSTIIRFGRGSVPDTAKVSVELGVTEIETGDEAVTLELDVGLARIAPGSRVRLTPADDGSYRFEVMVGRSEVERGAGERVAVEAGHRLELEIGVARVERVRPADAGVAPGDPAGTAAADPVEEVRDGGAAGEVAVAVRGGEVVARSGVVDDAALLRAGDVGEVRRDGSIRVTGRAPALIDLELAAGESATIHDPRPPTAVRLRFDRACRGDALLELTRGRSFDRGVVLSRGTGAASVSLGAGTRRYRIRCIDDGAVGQGAVAEGELKVVRDRGTRPLARTAPQNLIDADGRRYTVLYQSQLPAITFRWRTTAKPPYRLHVSRGGKTRTFDVEEATYTARSGTLGEGTYEYWFEASSSDVIRSKRSTLRIGFDNAAPSAYISDPAVAQRWEGTQLLVKGAALEGWAVSVGGQALALDRQHRFSATVPRPAGFRALSVRFSHPQRGAHYFLRRDGGD